MFFKGERNSEGSASEVVTVKEIVYETSED
jgi:hypothetical protein